MSVLLRLTRLRSTLRAIAPILLAGTLATITAPVSRAQTVAGELLEPTIGQPLRGFPVRLLQLTGDTPLLRDSARTDERGLFQLGGKGAGRYVLRFGPEGTALETSVVLDSISADTTIERRYAVSVVHSADSSASRDVVKPAPHAVDFLRLRYPKDMAGMRIESAGKIRFVVDETGHVVLGTVFFATPMHPSFKRAIHEALRTATFTPGRVGGVAVPLLVELPFSFAIRRQ